MIKAVAIDLDGTLTNSNKEVTEKTKQALYDLMQSGIKVILASGRPIIGIEKVADAIGLDKFDGYVIAYNGGLIKNYRTGEVLEERVIDICFSDIVDSVGDSVAGVAPLTYDECGVITRFPDNEYVKLEGFNNGVPVKHVESLKGAVLKSVTKYMVVGEPEKLSDAKAILDEKLGDELDVFYSMPYFLEIVPKGIEKAAALSGLLEYLSFSRDELMAIGDGLNDLPMLKYAGVAVAMGNACEEVKAIADFVVSDNDSDGVAEAVRMIGGV